MSLTDLGFYNIVFEYLCQLWQDEFTLVSQHSAGPWGRTREPFVGENTRLHSSIVVYGHRFGCYTSLRGRGLSFAYIDGRTPVRIEYILHVVHPREHLSYPSISATLILVRRLVWDESIPKMPWDHR